MTITHTKTSVGVNDGVAGNVQASDWNAEHTLDPVTLTAALNVATSALKGLAPASGGGTTNFLRADLTWTAPSGGLADGDKGDITVSSSGAVWTIDPATITYAKMQNVSATQRVHGRNTAGAGVTEEVTATQLFDWVSNTNGVLLTRIAGTWGAAAGVVIDSGQLVLTATATPAAAPSAGTTRIYGGSTAARAMLGAIGPAGRQILAQPLLGQQHAFQWTTNTSNSLGVVGVGTPVVTGTATARAIAATNSYTAARRFGSVSAATAAAVGGTRNTTAFLLRQEGFYVNFRFGIGDAVITTTGRTFVGITASTAAPTDVDVSTLVNLIGVGCDASDTVLQIYGAGAAAQARISLGANFPTNTTQVDLYEIAIYAPPGGATVVNYEVTRLNTGDRATGTLTGVQIPTATTLLSPQLWRTNGVTAAAVGIDLFSLYGDTEF